MKKIYLWLAVLLSTSAAIPAEAVEWYLEGTLGFEWSLAADYSDADSAAKNPPALFGTGPGRMDVRLAPTRFWSISLVKWQSEYESSLGSGPNWLLLPARTCITLRPILGAVPAIRGFCKRGFAQRHANCFLDIAPMFGFSDGISSPTWVARRCGPKRLSEMTYDFPSIL